MARTLVALTPSERLKAIMTILERVDARCGAADGPVPATRFEITDQELRQIYILAQRNKFSTRELMGVL